jgi:phage shock protein PspC (stress-responsive transcriptional regulator)
MIRELPSAIRDLAVLMFSGFVFYFIASLIMSAS